MKRLSWIVLSGLVAAVGCSSEGGVDEVDNGFESDDPTGRTASERLADTDNESAGTSADAGAAAPQSGDADAQRTVKEADIIKVDGDRLYTLSRYGGLAVLDIGDPDHMRVLGRKRIDGMPFEMYVEGTKAFVMLNDYGHWVANGLYGSWVQSSEIMGFDLSDPASIAEVAHFDVPGSISDSRLVGDVAYVVTYENGYCWHCRDTTATVVTSFKLGGAITKSDQLSFAPPRKDYASWQRSVSATNRRLYIAGPDWSWSGSGRYDSVIQVVDITDPNGRLVKGADVPVDGQITNRWQMDELDGVLRVVSQPGWSGQNPKLQTFTVTSSAQITPLGRTDIILPKPETLTSVRFDGTRGYASTSERTDPLFTLDLSVPATPRQVGSVELPGSMIYMEPHGNRLLGFGRADTTWNAPLAVTLFDVTDPARPTVLKQASFGAGWGSFAEDQDRIQKSVQVLEAEGLVLVPFASYGNWANGKCEQGKSGIQLLDWKNDDLVPRGIAPQYGMPRRAFLAKGRLVGMSDRSVSSFDISSRDNPTQTGSLDLANPAYKLLELPAHVASITSDWWTGEAMLSLTPKANADLADSVGKISLASLADPDPKYCGQGTSSWAEWYAARSFAVSPTTIVVAVPVSSYTYEGGKSTYRGKLVTASIDITDPKTPRLAGRADLAFRDTNGWWGYGGWFDGYGLYSYYGGMNGSLVASGQQLVQYGTKLAYLETTFGGDRRYPARRVHVVDYADATKPRSTSPVELPGSLGSSPLHLFHGTVLASRWTPSLRNPDRVRFYMDRIDLRGETPVQLSSVNIPGSLLLADETSNRIVTTDYNARRSSASDYADCTRRLGWNAWYDHDRRNCIAIDRSFKLSDVADTKVSLRQTFSPPTQNIAGVAIADDRIYVTRYKRYDYTTYSYDGLTPPRVLEDGGLWALGGIRAGRLDLVSQLAGDANWPLAASGSKVALSTDGGIAIYDTATPTPTLLRDVKLRSGWGYATDVLMSDRSAIAALGEWGLQTVTY